LGQDLEELVGIRTSSIQNAGYQWCLKGRIVLDQSGDLDELINFLKAFLDRFRCISYSAEQVNCIRRNFQTRVRELHRTRHGA
jgi:hypothetical protein